MSTFCLASVRDNQADSLVTTSGVPFEAPKHYPAFSWDKVPVYMMFAHDDRLLQDSETRKIAAESDFICIEKNHGLKPFGDAVLGLEHEARAFKKLKPEIVVLGYLNAALAYPFTRYTQMLTADQISQYPEMKAYLVSDPKTGKPAQKRGLYGYNVLNPEMRSWWSDSAAEMVLQTGADGIFIDQMHGWAWLHGSTNSQAVVDGVADMMAQLKAKIGSDKILLANNGAHIDQVFDVSDAFMFEHYNRTVTHTKEKLLEDWQLMEKIADAGKICIYRFGAEPESGSLLLEAGRTGKLNHKKKWAELSKEQLEFYLSLYLIGAQPYSYFQWSWGWGLTTGPLEHYPEFHKPLGKPLGKYTRTHPDLWEFTREFEHASVWVDTDKWEAEIKWK
ncbi:putative glycoside hydrolase [Pontiella sulfatireligans]|nr:putative glycoside hydrolase [Pontiella sulfatireligans]